MLFRSMLLAGLLLIMAPFIARADVTARSKDGFSIRVERTLNMNESEAWERLVNIPSWWSSDHSWSGDAANMTAVPAVGGCWCESWEDGEVVHGRVIGVIYGELLRLSAPLGPLQDMGVRGVLTLSLSADETTGAVRAVFDYVVVGADFQELDALAPVVDGVITDQIDRFVTLSKP